METNDVFLHSFLPVFPAYELRQGAILDWTMKAHERTLKLLGSHSSEKLEELRKYFVDEEQIRSRWYECDDVDEHWDNHTIYALTAETPRGQPIFERHEFYARKVEEVFGKIYQKTPSPEHLIHVTCTGYVSPSPPQRFFAERDTHPEITHAYHMGCYASIPAVRLAESLVKGRGIAVDVVHTEVCSIHLDPREVGPEQMVVQSLFADGHMKYSLSREARGHSLKLLALHEEIVPDSAQDMTWVPGPVGMKMTLSKEVPMKIAWRLGGFLKKLYEKSGYSEEELRRRAVYAIHPGGPKIVSGIQRLLGLSDAQVAASRKVLFERGNMSSATLPHVWEEILRVPPEEGTPVVAMAFGPGLTMIGGVFEVRK